MKNKLKSAYEIPIRRKDGIRGPYAADFQKGDKLMLCVKVAWIRLKHEFM
jgi:hypothetical protein